MHNLPRLDGSNQEALVNFRMVFAEQIKLNEPIGVRLTDCDKVGLDHPTRT